MKAFGGTYDQYLDTPEEAIEALLRIDGVYAEAENAVRSQQAPSGPSIPTIS